MARTKQESGVAKKKNQQEKGNNIHLTQAPKSLTKQKNQNGNQTPAQLTPSVAAREAKEENTNEQKTTEKKQYITKEMSIMEIITMYPETMEVLLAAGLHCVGCYLSPYETLEMRTVGHGMPEEDLALLLQELNNAVEAELAASSGTEHPQEPTK
ncbi:MAG: DUF1858 domain-containing protein [Candidatus Woesearchaeota archaeon]